MQRCSSITDLLSGNIVLQHLSSPSLLLKGQRQKYVSIQITAVEHGNQLRGTIFRLRTISNLPRPLTHHPMIHLIRGVVLTSDNEMSSFTGHQRDHDYADEGNCGLETMSPSLLNFPSSQDFHIIA